MDWFWISEPLARALHSEQLAAHGGSAGIRDANLLDSALQRPRNLVAYGDPDAAALAASLAYGIARNHPFVDGNKRTAFVASATFLELNGWSFDATQADVVVTTLALAAGELTEDALADWFRANIQPR
ncbi:death-on-curing protein [Polymorphobacter glacialis]|uniref:Death-on-curing protein n=1 Tax=Sandarakinorhabdus glacialis TaxID=1614636 RepID=A0A916ZUF4_9SPHN|nr:type II toxin-antitoxin system death-on-curing family toxin [Polymorphobacter glacialis]GGE13295.1 death-on-curing protein [Polymorphobacter glacialis]